MKILSYKQGGKYDYDVSFETAFEKKKIETNDRPKGELRAAAQSVALAAASYFRFEGMLCMLRQITFSYPEAGNETFTLELNARVNPIRIDHVIKSEKIDITEYETKSPGLIIEIEQKNTLVKTVVELREEIEKYVSGEREQQDIDFDGKSAKEDGGAELFETDEVSLHEGTVENWEDIDEGG
jgi:hypothetical protein